MQFKPRTPMHREQVDTDSPSAAGAATTVDHRESREHNLINRFSRAWAYSAVLRVWFNHGPVAAATLIRTWAAGVEWRVFSSATPDKRAQGAPCFQGRDP